MAKSNYAAWHVNPKGFSDKWDDVKKLKFFARYAILAPSGHNTQPWRLSVGADNLALKADYDRSLPYSGVQANEPFVSLGAFLGSFELAAKGFGYRLSITYTLRKEQIATISLAGKTTPEPELLDAISRRLSNRFNYDKKKLPEKMIKELVSHPYKHVSATVITDDEDIEYLADQTKLATLATMGDKEFRAELSKWVRNNITRRHDGMPGFVQGIPTPPSLLARHIIKRINVSKDQAKKDSSRLLNSANLVIVSVEGSSKESLLNAGRLFTQVCTLAQKHGIASTGAGAAVIDSATREAVAKHFNLSGRPIALIRLGSAKKKARHTPRWPLSKIME